MTDKQLHHILMQDHTQYKNLGKSNHYKTLGKAKLQNLRQDTEHSDL
jgi:hypothetical protein